MYWEHLHLYQYAAHYYKPRPYLTFMHVLHQHSVASDLTDHMTSIYLQILAVFFVLPVSAIVYSESTHVLCLVILCRQIKNLICQLINYPVFTMATENMGFTTIYVC